MPDARTTVGRVVAGETDCAVEWRLEGTFDGAAFMDIEPTGGTSRSAASTSSSSRTASS